MLAACGQNRDGQLQRFEAESARLAAAECACGAAPAADDCAARRALATGFDADCVADAFAADPAVSARLGCEIGTLRQLAECLEADCECAEEDARRVQLAGCGFRGEAFEGPFWASYVDCFTAGPGTCPSGPRLEGDGPFAVGALSLEGDGITPSCASASGLPDRSYTVESAPGPRQATLTVPTGPQDEQALTLAAYDGCDGVELACIALRPGEPTTLTVPATGPFVLVVDGHLRDDGELTLTTP
ncbi:MAG: hypothetical protein AAF447_14660 [Myxococcota bacterium]